MFCVVIGVNDAYTLSSSLFIGVKFDNFRLLPPSLGERI